MRLALIEKNTHTHKSLPSSWQGLVWKKCTFKKMAAIDTGHEKAIKKSVRKDEVEVAGLTFSAVTDTLFSRRVGLVSYKDDIKY